MMWSRASLAVSARPPVRSVCWSRWGDDRKAVAGLRRIGFDRRSPHHRSQAQEAAVDDGADRVHFGSLFFDIGVVLLVLVVILVARKPTVAGMVGIPALAGPSVLHGFDATAPRPVGRHRCGQSGHRDDADLRSHRGGPDAHHLWPASRDSWTVWCPSTPRRWPAVAADSSGPAGSRPTPAAGEATEFRRCGHLHHPAGHPHARPGDR